MKFITVGLLLLASLFIAFSASATTYVLNPDGTGHYSTIRTAIRVAQNGDVIELTDGVYDREAMGSMQTGLDFEGKSITLCSQSGNAAACILDVGGTENDRNERAINIHSGETRSLIIKDLTIANGYADAC